EVYYVPGSKTRLGSKQDHTLITYAILRIDIDGVDKGSDFIRFIIGQYSITFVCEDDGEYLSPIDAGTIVAKQDIKEFTNCELYTADCL
ncbi:MAG: hypothetical protein Q4D71_10210, partial [Oscillospiraceae bacterium]|nr:hypothetical protein [Oscillospiraceae bacterium]